MSVAQAYLQSTPQVGFQAPDFAAVRSTAATQVLGQLAQFNAQLEASMANAAIAGKAGIATEKAKYEGLLDVAREQKKPTFLDKLTALSALGGAASGSGGSTASQQAGAKLIASSVAPATDPITQMRTTVGGIQALEDSYGSYRGGSQAILGNAAEVLGSTQPASVTLDPAPAATSTTVPLQAYTPGGLPTMQQIASDPAAMQRFVESFGKAGFK